MAAIVAVMSKGLIQAAASLVCACLQVPSFREVGACGTATVAVPIASVTDSEKRHDFGDFVCDLLLLLLCSRLVCRLLVLILCWGVHSSQCFA
jgi:hypothetical protein